MVAAQVQIGRVVTVSLDAGRMEYVVDAQQAFEVAVGVHIAPTAGTEAVFEDIGQFGIGVGGWQGVEVTACQYGVGAGNYQLADAVRLFGAFHEVVVQGSDGALHDFCFTTGVVTVGKSAFPFPAVLADAGGLQVVVEQTDGVASQDNVALHATVGALLVGNELGIDERVAAEHGDRKHSADRILSRDQGVAPVGKYVADAVHREVFVVATFLEAEDVDFLFFHVAGDFLAGVACNLSSELANVVGGYFQVSVGIIAAVVPFGNLLGEAELEDGKDISVVEN